MELRSRINSLVATTSCILLLVSVYYEHDDGKDQFVFIE